MTLDEAIKHAEEVANEKENLAKTYETFKDFGNHKSSITSGHEKCLMCAEEHRQLAEWLKELKQLREQENSYGCCGCAFEDVEVWEMPCSKCKRGCKDYWRPKKARAESESRIMAKRTLNNCSLIKKMGGYPEQTETECLGFGRSEIDDEPCEICKKCKLYMGYYEDEE